MAGPVSRRRFLGWSAGAVAAAFVPGCTDNAPGPRPSAVASSPEALDVPFGVFERMLTAVRASPDHLEAAAERAVATADPERIFAFVRDSIAVQPYDDRGFASYPSQYGRWGVRGTLRGGMGTARDKADVLAELLRRAGFEATVVAGAPAVDLAQVRAAVLHRIEREFAPDVDAATVEHWRALMGASGPAEAAPTIDADGSDSARLAEQLLRLLPTDAVASEFSWDIEDLPVVRVVVDGAPVYANPLLPDAVYGEAYTTGEPTSQTGDASGISTITVRLAVTNSAHPAVEQVVAQGEWSLSDLLGRQLQVQFTPAADPEQLLLMQMNDVRSFVATLGVRGPDLASDDAVALSFVGDMVTDTGNVIIAAEDGSVTVDGAPLVLEEPDPAVVASVAKVDVVARANSFPTVALDLAVTDASGAPVQGLTASELAVAEEGVPRTFLLTQNTARPPRVLVLLDLSASIPEQFLGPAAVTLAERLATRLFAAHEGLEMQVAAVSAPSLDRNGDWTTDAAEVARQADIAGFGSDLWQALAGANQLEPSVIVFVTDADWTDVDTPEARAAVGRGAPIVALGVGPVVRDNLDLFARLSGGVALSVDDQDAAVDAVSSFLADRGGTTTYHLTYIAEEDGPPQREVGVTIGTASGSAAYDVPVEADRTPPPRLASLRLTVGIDGHEVHRVLAGYGGTDDDILLPPGTFEDVRAALFGSAVLSFEGPAPTRAAWVADLLTAKLASRPMWEAAEADDTEALLSAYASGFYTVDPTVFAMHPALVQSDGALTYEVQPRIVLHHLRPRAEGIVRSVDILSSARWFSAAADPRAAFEATVRATARLGVVEAGLFTSSTLTALEDQQLVALAPFQSPDLPDAREVDRERLVDLIEATELGAWHRVVSRTATPPAFWAIDEETGTVLGILGDGSGGGSSVEEVNQRFDEINRFLNWLSFSGNVAGLGFAFGGFIALEKAITQQLRIMTLAVMAIGGPNGVDPSLAPALKALACDIAKAAAAANVPPYQYVDFWDSLIEALGGKLVKCP